MTTSRARAHPPYYTSDLHALVTQKVPQLVNKRGRIDCRRLAALLGRETGYEGIRMMFCRNRIAAHSAVKLVAIARSLAGQQKVSPLLTLDDLTPFFRGV